MFFNDRVQALGLRELSNLGKQTKDSHMKIRIVPLFGLNNKWSCWLAMLLVLEVITLVQEPNK